MSRQSCFRHEHQGESHRHPRNPRPSSRGEIRQPNPAGCGLLTGRLAEGVGRYIQLPSPLMRGSCSGRSEVNRPAGRPSVHTHARCGTARLRPSCREREPSREAARVGGSQPAGGAGGGGERKRTRRIHMRECGGLDQRGRESSWTLWTLWTLDTKRNIPMRTLERDGGG